MKNARHDAVIVKSVEELLIYQKSITAADAISALLQRPAFRKDWELSKQLRAASGRIPPLIAEGFSQSTDRHFAQYLYRARGSAHEVQAHLRVAHGRAYLSGTELSEHCSRYEEIAKMLSGLIKHLRTCDRKERG